MTTTKTLAAEALSPMLTAFQSIEGRSLRAVWKVCTQGSLDRLILDFGPVSLVVAADENDDTVDIALASVGGLHKSRGIDESDIEPWKSVIGKPFGWGWVTVNHQGYCDGLLLSFGGIVPQLAINVVASSIKVGAISGMA